MLFFQFFSPPRSADQVDALLPVLLAAALEDIAESVKKHIVAGVAAIGLVAQEQSGPLLVGHSGGAGVGQHINGQQSGGERELVPVGGVQSALTLLNSGLGQVAHRKGAVLGHLNILSQRIVLHILVHFVYLHLIWRFAPSFY